VRFAGAGLARNPFTKQRSATHSSGAREGGTRAFNECGFSRPWERFWSGFLLRPAEGPSDTPLLDASSVSSAWFFGIEARTFQSPPPLVFVNPGCQYSNVDTERFELIMKRFAEAVYIRLSRLRHSPYRENAFFLRTHCPHED